MFGSLFVYQVAYSFITYVSRQREETCTYDPKRYSLDSLSAMFLRVNGHTPQQRSSRRNFDEAVHAKTDKGDAAGKCSRHNCNDPFEAVPGDGEILQPLSPLSKHVAFQGKLNHEHKNTSIRATSSPWTRVVAPHLDV